MLTRIRNREKGFTLIELLIVVAIIGIIAALLIPNFLDALQKAKQKRTVADMRNAGTALFSWLTDQVGAAAAGQGSTTVDLGGYNGGTAVTGDKLTTVLVPQYLQAVPVLDGWKHPFDYYLDTGNPLAKHVMAIRAYGRDNKVIGASYTVTSFDPTDYDQDIVWADGFFVRWPQKATP